MNKEDHERMFKEADQRMKKIDKTSKKMNDELYDLTKGFISVLGCYVKEKDPVDKQLMLSLIKTTIVTPLFVESKEIDNAIYEWKIISDSVFQSLRDQDKVLKTLREKYK